MIALDSGAVIALSAGSLEVRGFVRNELLQGGAVLIPAPALSETVRGNARDAAVNPVLKHCLIGSVDEAVAREAGRLLGRTTSKKGAKPNTVDAMIVAVAARGGASVIITSDPDDIAPLARCLPRPLSVEPISRRARPHATS